MLTQLHIRNFTIIEQLDIDFYAGMTAITGETGAGKSIILDALEVLLGGRANHGLIRQHCERCDISAVFCIADYTHLRSWLEQKHLANPDDAHECMLRRYLTADGRSRAFVNGQLVPLHVLRELTQHLLDIHSQHEHQRLFNRETQRLILDSYGKHQALSKQVAAAHQQWDNTRRKLASLQNPQHNQQARIDLLRYQLDELHELAISENEIEMLHQEQHTLSHSQETQATLQHTIDLLNDGEKPILQQLQHSIALLEKTPGASGLLANSIGLLRQACIHIQEAHYDMQSFARDTHTDPQRLEKIEQRLQTLYDMARKHRVKPEQLPDTIAQLQQELDEISQCDERVNTLLQELATDEKIYLACATQLNHQRAISAKRLAQQVTENMHALSMQGGNFAIELIDNKESLYAAHGLETVEFRVTANPGQALAPLNKVASGGELSRISLALHVIIAQHYQTPTLIFDEVDVGIGGATAEIVGQLLRRLGDKAQILCITHLAQVAAQANQHMLVNKIIVNDTTQTQLITLDKTQRIREIARMLGGKHVTSHSLAHAEEMLNHTNQPHKCRVATDA